MDIRKKILRALEEKKFKERYYKCPNCGGLSTFTEQLDACSSGGMPYCYCKYGGAEGRVFVGYKRISKEEYFRLKGLKKST